MKLSLFKCFFLALQCLIFHGIMVVIIGRFVCEFLIYLNKKLATLCGSPTFVSKCY